MKRADAYLLRNYLATLAAALAVMVAAALVLEFLEKARVLLGEKSSLSTALFWLVLRLPQFGGMLLPVALVLAISLANARLGRQLEFRALAAAGLGWSRLLLPVLLAGGLTVILGLADSEWLSPPAAKAELQLQRTTLGWLERSWQFFQEKRWFRGEPGRIFQVVGASADGRAAKTMHLFRLDENYSILQRVHLNEPNWTGEGWKGSSAEEWLFAGGRLVENRRIENPFYRWPEGPEYFRPLHGVPRSLRLGELSTHARELERRGLNAAAYRLEAHQRGSYPLCGLILVLMAFPWQTSPGRRRSASGALLEASGLILLAYLLVAACSAAVAGGALSPWQGAWLPPALLLLAMAASWSIWHRKGVA